MWTLKYMSIDAISFIIKWLALFLATDFEIKSILFSMGMGSIFDFFGR